MPDSEDGEGQKQDQQQQQGQQDQQKTDGLDPQNGEKQPKDGETAETPGKTVRGKLDKRDKTGANKPVVKKATRWGDLPGKTFRNSDAGDADTNLPPKWKSLVEAYRRNIGKKIR